MRYFAFIITIHTAIINTMTITTTTIKTIDINATITQSLLL